MQNPARVALETVIQRNNDLVFRNIDQEIVMLSVEAGKYFGLDEVGSRIWSLLEIPRRVNDLCAVLQEEFDVDHARCEADVLVFLNELAERDLVKVADGEGR